MFSAAGYVTISPAALRVQTTLISHCERNELFVDELRAVCLCERLARLLGVFDSPLALAVVATAHRF